MDKKSHHGVLTKRAVPRRLAMHGKGLLLQENHNPKHLSAGITWPIFFFKNKQRRMVGPPSIEWIWDLKSRLPASKKCSKDDLWGHCQGSWNRLTLEELLKYSRTMPEWCKWGNSTKLHSPRRDLGGGRRDGGGRLWTLDNIKWYVLLVESFVCFFRMLQYSLSCANTHHFYVQFTARVR